MKSESAFQRVPRTDGKDNNCVLGDRSGSSGPSGVRELLE